MEITARPSSVSGLNALNAVRRLFEGMFPLIGVCVLLSGGLLFLESPPLVWNLSSPEFWMDLRTIIGLLTLAITTVLQWRRFDEFLRAHGDEESRERFVNGDPFVIALTKSILLGVSIVWPVLLVLVAILIAIGALPFFKQTMVPAEKQP